MVLPFSDRISRAPPYSHTHNIFTCTGLSPFIADFPKSFQFYVTRHWPNPLSLTTTRGVSFDVLSSGYLDVSVPRVHLINLCIQLMIPSTRWVSPFGYLRINAYCQLPVAFRRLSRPSSSLSAKAFTRRPFLRLIPSTIRRKLLFTLIISAFLFEFFLIKQILNYSFFKFHQKTCFTLVCQIIFFFTFSMSFLFSSMVEVNGLEPTTPCLQSRCSTN